MLVFSSSFFFSCIVTENRRQGTAMLFLGVMTHQAWLSVCVQVASPAPATGRVRVASCHLSSLEKCSKVTFIYLKHLIINYFLGNPSSSVGEYLKIRLSQKGKINTSIRKCQEAT